jgi:iron complex transport system substrate-binding protein
MRNSYRNIIFFSLLIFFSCGQKELAEDPTNIAFEKLAPCTDVKYAKRFSIYENEKVTVIFVFANTNIADTTASFILLKDKDLKLPKIPNAFILNSTCTKIASLGSVYSNMICALGKIESIAAVENMDYYTNPELIKKHQEKPFPELAKNPELDVEQCILLSPDIVLSFGMGNALSPANKKIIAAGIPLLVAGDNFEDTPLARAEWIKLYACFVGERKKADSIFNSVEKNYKELSAIAASAKTRPKVLTEIKYGELWYVPGGKSFAATLIHDAGGDYCWKEDQQTGSLGLGFEEVFVKAGKAEIWLNQALVKTKKELLAQESRYADFEAFKKGELYNNIKNVNEKGYSDYWETGMIYPDRILSDLIQLFHPELKAQLNRDLYYYKKLE